MLVQIIIALTGAAAIWLVNSDKRSHRKCACVFGLVGQPFWFHTSFVNDQWGVFFLTVIFTVSWIRGFINNTDSGEKNGNNKIQKKKV